MVHVQTHRHYSGVAPGELQIIEPIDILNACSNQLKEEC